jgi:hypothetical protein
MKQKLSTAQAGYALLLTVLALMGIGGVVLAGFTQSARQELEVQRYQHNQRVLEQAKQALLMFAYNYPKTNVGEGPGKLLCPDFNNDGDVDATADCNNKPGRFPWSDPRLNTERLVDASGETLWYAVSDAFYNLGGGGVINYDTSGTITLVDQSGGIVYDGAVAGIAAVIIAPGPTLKRDEDANGTYEFTQLRDTTGVGGQQRDPRNYLDTFNGFDNSVFTNGESDSNDDGFIMGPVYDAANSTVVVNDQLIIITADEVIAMAEMATLEAYRTAILEYLDYTGGVYPWLYNYDGVEYDTGVGETNDDAVAKLSTYYPADTDFVTIPNYHDDNGRIPSIFASYFTETDSLKIESKLVGSLEIDFTGLSVNSSGRGVLDFENGVLTIPIETNNVLTEVGFEDLATDGEGRFTATMPAPQSFSKVLYFWDDDDNPRNLYTVCPDDGDGVSELSDCWRYDEGPGAYGSGPLDPWTPNPNNDGKEHILRVVIQITLGGTVIVDANYQNNPPTVALKSAADSNAHAIIQGTYSVPDLLATSNLPTAATITATYDWMDHYHSGNTHDWDPDDIQGNLADDDLLVGSTLTLGMNYFPVIPGWAFDNGWHNSIRMAYAEDHRPGVAGDCIEIPDDDCLNINDPHGPRDKVSLLLIGHGNDWLDNDEVLPGTPSVEDGTLSDELRDVFDEGNHNGNTTYYTHRGNDRILVIEEL